MSSLSQKKKIQDLLSFNFLKSFSVQLINSNRALLDKEIFMFCLTFCELYPVSRFIIFAINVSLSSLITLSCRNKLNKILFVIV